MSPALHLMLLPDDADGVDRAAAIRAHEALDAQGAVPRFVGVQLGRVASATGDEIDVEIRRAEIGVGAVRPLDETDAIALEILVQAGFKKLICMGEAIKIKVI